MSSTGAYADPSTSPDFLGLERHEIAWIAGGVFAFFGIVVSFVTM